MSNNGNNVVAERHQGMGAIVHDSGVAFRVWAPHATAVHVKGSFNDWSADANPMEAEDHGHWYASLSEAAIGDEYKYIITNGEQTFDRIDPYAREVTNSIGNTVIADPNFDWGDDDFQIANFNELIIYELHVGTFNRTSQDGPGDFADVEKKLEYLQSLGVNAIQIMPAAEFAGDISWGYNPAHIFAVESAYGGPAALKQLVRRAHQHGIAVIMDVVYNHFGPSDLAIWQFDGWSKYDDKGGIYFYNDHRSNTPWGDTRPDYGRGEVRQYIHDNAMMWLDEFRMDGLRYDMTLYMRSIDGSDENAISEGWSLAQWINREIHERWPHKITIAEDLRTNSAITQPAGQGGANFSSQWDEVFVHPVREAVTLADDQYRDMGKVARAISHRYNINSFERVIYSESHDEVANGKSRVPSEIDEGDADGWYARKRSTLAASLVFTAPGIPMIFQGQEFLTDKWFDDTDPIDWSDAETNDGILRMYRDLMQLRRNVDGVTKGLTGQEIAVHHVNHDGKVIAFRRWFDGGPRDECVVIANFSVDVKEDYRIGFEQSGEWKVRFDSSAKAYGGDFESANIGEITTEPIARDNLDQSSNFTLRPYGVLILSQD